MVLYTGKPRLAKNLLQNVIRNWYSQDPAMLASFADNLQLAASCWATVQAGPSNRVSLCLGAG